MDYSKNLREVFVQAKSIITTDLIEPNHLLAGVIMTPKSVGYQLLEKLIDIVDAKSKVSELYKVKNGEEQLKKTASLSTLSEQIMLQTGLEAKRNDSDIVKTEHLVLTFVKS